MKAIEIQNLTKRYKDFLAVDNISLSIEEGEIYGLLGPNGAGKSTTINIICGILNSSYGEIKILGETLSIKDKSARKYLGLVPQQVALYNEYSAYENVKFFGSLYGLKGNELEECVKKALEFTGLLDMKDKRASDFSGGMLRRLNIACGIVHNPKIVIMDEPTVGIDPQSRNHILQSVKKLNEKGTTVIYTTHYMEEVEEICSKIAIMDNGKVIVEGSKEELKSIVSDKKSLILRIDNFETIDEKEIKNIKGVTDVIIDENEITINTEKEINNLDKIINYFTTNKIEIRDIGYEDINLETVFLSLTGRRLRE
ncbi:ABC transporter ATP-binding protein [Clostridium senegalense]|uniref:ABC transporter ATP-binding protein n=1 Tax=Clostridium senegalense TaxID=1465809 RepID=A0A6M0H8H1_9CLOT|nr:ABC transporter ATP-binding protein [Clostridium senegalense]NEU06604.1 ABC transporter ATP-binding protein [Clostridium senegalense]